MARLHAIGSESEGTIVAKSRNFIDVTPPNGLSSVDDYLYPFAGLLWRAGQSPRAGARGSSYAACFE